jgi:hypothetical protein
VPLVGVKAGSSAKFEQGFALGLTGWAGFSHSIHRPYYFHYYLKILI